MDWMVLFDYVVRWGHYLFGIAWIGLLYYFNFVQGGYMAKASDEAKVDAFTKLVPTALWWFRYGALMTFLTGVVLLLLIFHDKSWTVDIILAATMATLMVLTVWGIIWPNQKVVIASNEAVAAGGESDPSAAGSAAKALLASRTNTFFSAPMLFLMGSHSEFIRGPFDVDTGAPSSPVGLILGLIIIAVIEANAIWGKTMVLTTVKGVITSSIVLTVVMAVVASL